MGIFAADWKTQIIKILQPVLRNGAAFSDFLKAAANQLNTAGAAMNTYDTLIRKQALYNGQIIVLRAALNEYFAVSGIYVMTNTSNVFYVFIYNKAEALPYYIFNKVEGRPTYFYNKAEIPGSRFDYTVFIPVGIYTAELDRRVRSVVKLFAEAGKTFTIATY